jgi:hypothetical protein
LALTCGVLLACAGFFYQRLDWLAVWYANGMVTLTDEQEQRLRNTVRDGVAWHRTTQLPRYRALLEEIDRDTDGMMTADQVAQHYDEMVGLWDVLLTRMVEDAAPLLRSLTPEQRDELFENLAEDNEDLRDEYAGSTPELRRKRRSKATIRAVQRFTGGLTEPQKAFVNASLDGMHDLAEEWLTRRRAWQLQFRAVLDSPADGTAFAAALRDLALRPDQFDSVEYRRKVSENRQMVFDMLAQLTGQLTPAQRDRMGRKLRGYAADLDELTQPG